MVRGRAEEFAAGTHPDVYSALGEQDLSNESKRFKRFRHLPEVLTGARPVEAVGAAIAALVFVWRHPDGEVIILTTFVQLL